MGGLIEGHRQQHGAAVFMNGQMRVPTGDLALFKHRIEGHYPMFAIVDHQNAAEIIPGKVYNPAVQASVPSGVSDPADALWQNRHLRSNRLFWTTPGAFSSDISARTLRHGR
jgi:hypothetical protein